MKLHSAMLKPFLSLPDPAVRAVLVYGSDNGQVCEVLDDLTTAMVANSQDPFRVSNLTAAAIRKDPTLLSDAVTTVPLTGGRRVVRIHEADDTITNIIEKYLYTLNSNSSDAFVVVIAAGTLGKASKLRRLFEAASTNVIAIPCYPDNPQTLEALIHGTLQQCGLRGERKAVAYLVERLGGDRLQTRSELEKLALYAWRDGHTVTLRDAMACIGDSTEPSLQSLAMAVADGHSALTERLYERLILEGMTPVGVLRALAHHFRRLYMATVIMTGDNRRAEEAMATLKPPPFFKLKNRFRAQLCVWSELQLLEVLNMLLYAEIQCKNLYEMSNSICFMTILQLLQKRNSFTQGSEEYGVF